MGAAVIDDLHELRTTAVSSIGGDVPVFLFGHSMGTLIALAYLEHHADGLAGSILCGVPVDVDDTAVLAAMLDAAGAAGMRDESANELLNNGHPKRARRSTGSAATPTKSTATSPTRFAAMTIR